MALDVGETLLGDAEERGFGDLGKTAKTCKEFERGFDAAALAETVHVFLKSGDEAEVVEQRRMQEVRESTDFAGHLLEEFAGLFERAVRGFVERLGGLAELREAEIYGENGLRHAVVKFAADAAALFILELEEFGGELVDGAFGVFEVGDVGEGPDDTENGAVGIELWYSVAENPEEFGVARTAPAHGGLADGTLGAEDGWDGAIGEGNFAALIVNGNHA
jgi:hypothetical protein